MKRENDKFKKALKEAKKESKKAKQDLENVRTDYDIAKDDQTDNENIEERYDKDINDLRQKTAHYKDENHMLDMKNMQQRKMIEVNTAAARLKEEEEKYKIKFAENQEQFEYMRSKRFTNLEEELRKMFSGQLKEEEKSRRFKPKRLMETI